MLKLLPQLQWFGSGLYSSHFQNFFINTVYFAYCTFSFFFVFQILTLMWLPVAVWGKNTMSPLHWNLQYEKSKKKSGSKNKLSHRSTRSESHSYGQSNLCKLFVDYLLKWFDSCLTVHRWNSLIQLTFQNCKNPLITAMQHFGLGFIFAEKNTFQYDFS